MGAPAFDRAAFAAALERVRGGKDPASENLAPRFDPQVHKDVVSDARRGRKIADYHQVLQHHGFRWIPREKLPLWNDGRPRTQGEFVAEKLKMSFSEDEVVANWAGPQDFDAWVEREKLKRRAAAAGIVMPRKRR